MKRKYKICALTTISKTMDWFVVDSMRNLSQNGYKITLISDMDEGFIERNKDYATCVNLKMNRGVCVRDIFRCVKFLRRYFKREKFDAIYYTSPNVSLYAAIAGKLAGVKIRFYNQCGLRYVSFTGMKRKIFWLVEKITCMLSTTIRAQSPLNMQFAIEEKLCNKEKISVVGFGGTTGVDIAECDNFDHLEMKKKLRTKYHIPQESFVFGYVGRINVDKGINELIEAFAKLEKKHDDIYLVMVGMVDNANPIKESNMRFAKKNAHIIMTGNVPADEVYFYMSMFDTLVHPTYREGLGKVLQEAMGVRIPIVTTNVPGPSEVVENGVSGVLANVKDSKDLAKKMEMLYSDEELRKRFIIEGRKRAEKYFDRPIMLNNILMDLNETMKKNRRN